MKIRPSPMSLNILRKKLLPFHYPELLSQRMSRHPRTLPILEPFNHGTASHWTPSWLLHVQPTLSSSCQGLTVTTWIYIAGTDAFFMSFNTSFARLLNVVQKCAKCAYAKERVRKRMCLSWIPDVLFKNPRSAKVHMYQQIKKNSWLSAGWKTKTNPQGRYTNPNLVRRILR